VSRYRVRDGYYLPEEQPEALLAELIPFLEPDRNG
jgi:hypothetical protein